MSNPKRPHKIIVYTDGAPYYLPIAVGDNKMQLARILGLSKASVASMFTRGSKRVYEVELTEEEWQEIEEIDRRYEASNKGENKR